MAADTLGAATTAVAADPGALAAARATHLVVIMSPGAVTGLARCGAWSAGSSSASSDAVSDRPEPTAPSLHSADSGRYSTRPGIRRALTCIWMVSVPGSGTWQSMVMSDPHLAFFLADWHLSTAPTNWHLTVLGADLPDF